MTTTTTGQAPGAELTSDAVRITEQDAAAILRDLWGLDGKVEWLWGEKDSNYRAVLGDGREFLLKILTPGENPDVTRMHSLALLHVEAADPSIPCQRVIRTRAGAPDGRITDTTGADRGVRLVTFVPGRTEKTSPQSAALRRSVGWQLAKMQQALKSFDHPAAHARLTWDMAHFPDLRPQIGLFEAALQPWLRQVMDRFSADIPASGASLPAQVIHNDFNQENILVDPAAPDVVAGVIDFGDMVYSARVFDIAVAASYQIRSDDVVGSVCDVLAGFAAGGGRLTQAEVDLLWITILVRNAMRLLIPGWQAVLFPDRAEYFHRNGALARRNIAALTVIDETQARAAFAQALQVQGATE